MTRLSPKPNAGPPQPVRHAPARPYIVIGSGVIAAIMLIIVVLNIRSAPNKAQQQEQQANEQTPTEIEILGPSGLTEEDLASTGNQIDPNTRLNLPSGGWIQVPNDTGGIAQQYRFDKLEPNPAGFTAGWVQMERPIAELFVAKDRMLRLEGDEATMFIPKQALESGTMTGNVMIRLYEVAPNQRIDPAIDVPSLVVRTAEASFNNITGELRCPHDVHVETPESEFPGTDLTLLLNDRDQMIQSMRVEHGQFIRIAGAAKRERTNAPTEPAPATQTPPGETRAVSPSEKTDTASAAKEEQFYLVQLHDNVRIEAGRGEGGRTVNGDRLAITFSFRSEGMSNAMAFLPVQQDGLQPVPASIALSPTQQMIAAAMASMQDRDLAIAPPPSDDDVYVYWDGPLTMDPITDPAQKLASPSDARLELFGSPITLTDDDGWTTVSCASLAYHTEAENPILLASAEYPGMLVRSDPALRAGQGGADDEPLIEELRITWGEALELDFYDSPDGAGSGRLKRATFTKDVNILSPDLNLTADDMTVGFFAGMNERDAIETVYATGNIVAEQPGASPEEQSKLTAKELLVEFGLGRDEKSFPKHARATGDVEAKDATETMWADIVDVVMRERTPEEQARAEATAASGSENTTGVAGMGFSDDRLGSTELEALSASGDVQLLLEGGTRVWAETLDVDGVNRTVELAGEEVLVAHENFLIDKGSHIALDDIRRKAMMKGPGQFRQFNKSVQPTGQGKLPKPVIELPTQVRVRWNEGMEFDEQFDQGNGAIEFHGKVEGVSEPNELERSTVSSETLRLEFVEKPADEVENEQPAADANPLTSGDRTLRRLYAAGDAKIESRTWEKEDRSDTPRVFYIAGEEIDYDDVRLDANVTGVGSLLIRDERPEKPGENKPVVVAPGDLNNPLEQENFGARGTTLFRFTEGMQMKQQMENRFLASFSGNVEWLHKSLDGRTATLTGQHLEAVISRRSTPGEDVDLDFGGAAELQRISGKGAMFIRTATRDVQCEDFTYDPSTGVAELGALPGRTVSVLTQGSHQPFHAERMIWYMNDDRMTIVGGTMNR